MKSSPSSYPTPLPRKKLRAVERRLGIYIDTPLFPQRSIREQRGIYDKNEKHVGDIIADDRYFIAEELTSKIEALLKSIKPS